MMEWEAKLNFKENRKEELASRDLKNIESIGLGDWLDVEIGWKSRPISRFGEWKKEDAVCDSEMS